MTRPCYFIWESHKIIRIPSTESTKNLLGALIWLPGICSHSGDAPAFALGESWWDRKPFLSSGLLTLLIKVKDGSHCSSFWFYLYLKCKGPRMWTTLYTRGLFSITWAKLLTMNNFIMRSFYHCGWQRIYLLECFHYFPFKLSVFMSLVPFKQCRSPPPPLTVQSDHGCHVCYWEHVLFKPEFTWAH